MKTLEYKIGESIELLRKGEKLALLLNPNGYYVTFSGGKDSQVLLELVKMSGVKFKAYYNVTTNDPPENVRFIRQFYKEVEFVHPKHNFFKLVEKRGLPTMVHRFCCAELKEKNGKGFLVATGVRKDESAKRSKYDVIEKIYKPKEQRQRKDLDEMERLNFQCVEGKDTFTLRPILEWTELDVWKFISKQNLPFNPVYNHSDRVGCMFCPFSSKEQIEFYSEKYPKYYQILQEHFAIFLSKSEKKAFQTIEEYFDWWKSKKSIDEYKSSHSQLQLFS